MGTVFSSLPRGQEEFREGFGRCPLEGERWVVSPKSNGEIVQTFR